MDGKWKWNANNIETALPDAIRSNDLLTVKDIVQKTQNYHHKKKHKALANALWLSCDRDRYDIAEFLLESGVDADVQVRGQSTPLMASASGAIVKLLLAKKAYVNAADETGKTALMYAKNPGVVEALIRGGAALEETDDRGQTALIHAATSETSGRVAICLLEHGADPTIRDNQEQNALVAAALTGRHNVVKEALTRGATTGPVDSRGRNILHHICESQRAGVKSQSLENSGMRTADVDILDTILENSSTNEVNARDFEGKTALHLAVARNNLIFVKKLLENKHCKADVNVTDNRRRSALHTTANNDRADIAYLLLQHGANVDAATDVGLTALHAAASRENDTLHTARVLLEHGANTNLLTENGRSALHFASKSGNLEVLNLLLDKDDLQITAKDKSGNTPLDYAIGADIVAILSRYGSRILTHNQLLASEDHIASVMYFASTKRHAKKKAGERSLIQRHPVKVASLLNGTFSVKPPWSGSRSEQSTYMRKNFQWIHLPANNIAWCREILLSWFMQSDVRDVEGFKRLQTSLKHEHSGRETHSHYMKAICEAMADHLNARGPGEEVSDSDAGEIIIPTTDRKQPKKRRISGSSPILALPKGSTQLSSRMVYLFMPYVHWESARNQERRQQTVDQVQKLHPRKRILDLSANHLLHRPTLQRRSTRTNAEPDAKLIQAHYEVTPCTLHIRRTLDQFSNPSTKISASQHQDQVVFKYQKKHNAPEDPSILMVDQLWMWIVNDDLVVTSFPRQWGELHRPANPHNVLEDVITEANSPDQAGRILHVYELAIGIADRCFSTYGIRDEFGQSYLDMFQITIDEVTKGEKEVSARFRKASHDASAWLDNPGSPKPVSIQRNLLEIVTESQDLLRKIREVDDELDILKTIFLQQKKVLSDMARHILSALERNETSSINRKKVETMLWELGVRADNLVADVQYLKEQTDRITKSIKDVLDLKESFVNALQIADTSNQNQALMIFTIVTVIFSPLSFFTSFFALNVKEWPHNSQGNTEFSLHYIERYVFGVGFAIAVPCVIYALTLNRLSYWGRKWREFFRRHFPALSNSKQSSKRPTPAGGNRVPTWTSTTSTDLEKG